MRKTMIVDDERWVRQGLIQLIPWERFGLELSGEAADGVEGYEEALRVKPDILFLDMRMPGLDGRQLLGMLNRDLPDTITIVVSGYSDFEYTREAIRNRAFEYLLKPVKKEELHAVLEKAVAELDERDRRERRASLDHREEWLRRVLFRPSDADAAEPAPPPAGELPAWWSVGRTLAIAGLPDAFGNGGCIGELLRSVRDRLEKEKPFLFEGRWDFFATAAPTETGEFVLALAAEKPDEAGLQRLGALLQQLSKQLEGAPSFSFGVGGWKSAAELRQAYREARVALLHRPLHAFGALLGYPPSPSAGGAYPTEAEHSFLLALQTGNPGVAAEYFDALFARLTTPGSTVDSMQRGANVLLHSIEKQLREGGARFDAVAGKSPAACAEAIARRNDPDSLRALFEKELLPALLAHYNRSGEKQGDRIVREVEKWIAAHYDQPLSMQTISAMHYMNPDYLSRLFKKSTGRNFVDYLTDVRIEKAKALMKLETYKNYEIAQMVGYEDYRYFSQIFKKKTGMTIGEFRESAAARGKPEELGAPRS
ncbi:response regulator [Paenibacillus sp.]|uniref:response regulator n=1 Tax=Paenibacillus sp. TaxID=58172 RepID=UPI002D75143D|nr:response regulator [Paenibacillus sp.]HZG83761.1 response regulator [Paenibacillus sp.]